MHKPAWIHGTHAVHTTRIVRHQRRTKRERTCIWDEGRVKIRGGTRRVNTLPTGLPVQRKGGLCLELHPIESVELSPLDHLQLCQEHHPCSTQVRTHRPHFELHLLEAHRAAPARSTSTLPGAPLLDPATFEEARFPAELEHVLLKLLEWSSKRGTVQHCDQHQHNTRTIRRRKRATLSSPLTALGVTAGMLCYAAAVHNRIRDKTAGNFAFQSCENFPGRNATHNLQ